MKEGDLVPNFILKDDDGNARTLRELLAGGPLVLYFYPAALSPGCTAESCTFRDRGAEFASLGATRVGVSSDAVERQKAFSERHHFDFPLLSDPDYVVATLFGTHRRVRFLPTKRWTFVIDSDRRVLSVIKNEIRMGVHADRALDVLRERQASMNG